MKTFVIEGTLKSEQPLATCSAELMERVGRKNEPAPVPFIETAEGKRLMFPATSLRGTLRRAARDVVRKHVIAQTGNDKPFSLDQHYFLTLGGIKGTGKLNRNTLGQLEKFRAANPVISMFGAGDAGVLDFVSGHLSVGNAICKTAAEPVIFSGARTDEFYRDKSQVAYLSDADLDALISRSIGGKDRSNLEAEIKQLAKEAGKHRRSGNEVEENTAKEKIAALQAQVKEVLEQTGTSAVGVGMPLAGWQAIPVGQLMDHRMILKQSNDIELGLLLAALNQFAQNPVVGAHYATGCGLVSGEWEIFEVSDEGKISRGQITLTPFEPLQMSSTALTDAKSAFEQFMQSTAWDFSIPTSEKTAQEA